MLVISCISCTKPPNPNTIVVIIDRAMVGHGLLSPEELVDIHKVGDEMAAAKPDMATASVAADQAVRDLAEERKRRKEAMRLLLPEKCS